MKRYLITPFLWGLALAASAAAHPPYGLVADRAGNLYFSDLETVWRLSPDGRLSVFRPHVPDTHVHALALAPDGAIEGDLNRYDPATQRFYSGLWRRTPAGAERPVLAMTDRPPAGWGLWQDRAGNRYTSQWRSSADRRMLLLRRRPGGRVDLLFDEAPGAPRPPQTTVESIGGMAFGADGSLFFTNGSVLWRLASNGRTDKLYDGGRGSSLRGLAAAPDGKLVAADMGAKQVLLVAGDGKVSTLYRETAAWSPTAVALAGGRLLVLEANDDPYERNDRVRLVEVKTGRGKVIASPASAKVAKAPPPSSGAGPGGPGLSMMLLACLAGLGLLLAASRFRRLWLRRARGPAVPL